MREAYPFAFLAGLALLSAAIVRVMLRRGILDHPGTRSSHNQPTPTGGGVGIVAAFVIGVGAVLLIGRASLPMVPALGLLAGTLLIAAVSYLDDLYDWPFTVKLAAQTCAACLVIACDIRIHGIWRIHGTWLPMPDSAGTQWLGALLTLVCILFVTNAVNFIDGLNGLASGSVGLACLFLAPIAARAQNGLMEACSLAMAGGVAGFLPYNFPHARIFMGDVGSQTCGFVIACLGVMATGLPTQVEAMVLVPALMSGVLFDVLFTLARRLIAGDRLTQAHRSHLYQIANRAGLPAAYVTIIYWMFTVWGGAYTLIYLALPKPFYGSALIWLAVPQALWLAAVVVYARRSGVGRW